MPGYKKVTIIIEDENGISRTTIPKVPEVEIDIKTEEIMGGPYVIGRRFESIDFSMIRPLEDDGHVYIVERSVPERTLVAIKNPLQFNQDLWALMGDAECYYKDQDNSGQNKLTKDQKKMLKRIEKQRNRIYEATMKTVSKE